MNKETLRVGIVEDDAGLRQMLERVFARQEDMVLAFAHGAAEDAIADERAERPHVAVMDVNLPGMSGTDAVRELATRWPRTQFLMYTVNEDDKRVFDALRNGASGYVLKSSSPQQLLEAVRELHAGGAPMSPAIARRIVDHFRPAASGPGVQDAGLGPREHGILVLLADGLFYKEIADRMGISIGTVKSHAHAIYRKLHVHNRTEAVNRFFGR